MKWKEAMERLRDAYEMPTGVTYEGLPDCTRENELQDVQTMIDGAVSEVFPPDSIDDVDRMDLEADVDACLASIREM